MKKQWRLAGSDNGCFVLLSLFPFFVSSNLHIHLHSSFLLTIIVEKSKMCLDFSVTYFILHLVISSVYYQVPATADWWIVHVFATIVMVLVGEYLCSLRELSDIPLLQL